MDKKTYMLINDLDKELRLFKKFMKLTESQRQVQLFPIRRQQCVINRCINRSSLYRSFLFSTFTSSDQVRLPWEIRLLPNQRWTELMKLGLLFRMLTHFPIRGVILVKLDQFTLSVIM